MLVKNKKNNKASVNVIRCQNQQVNDVIQIILVFVIHHFLHNFIQTFKCFPFQTHFVVLLIPGFLKFFFLTDIFYSLRTTKLEYRSMRHKRISDFFIVCVRIVTTLVFPHVA